MYFKKKRNLTSMKLNQKKADTLIALVAVLWGTSYLLMKIGLDTMGPFNIIALRFGIAFILTSFIFHDRFKNLNGRLLLYSSLLGFLLFLVFSFLMYGLRTTSTSTAGFLTSTTVLFIPFLQFIFFGKRPQFKILFSTTLTLSGISLLTMQDSLKLNTGAILCLIGAFIYGIHLILTDLFTKKEDGLLLGILQLGSASLFGSLSSVFFESPSLPQTKEEWFAILGLAILCSAFGFVIQPAAQKYTTPEHTGILFTLEPVSTTILAFLFLHEQLTFKGFLGSLFVIFSVFISVSNFSGLRSFLSQKQVIR